MAIRRRCPDAGLLHHAKHGSTYASEDYQNVLAHGIPCSMSRKGSVFDNAAMESWNSTFKAECGERFPTNAAADEAVFDYVEVFCNQQLRHSAIGYKSPAEYERAVLGTASRVVALSAESGQAHVRLQRAMRHAISR